MKRLLIVRPDGIGDFVIFSAVLERYAEVYPDYRIDLLCDASVKELAEAVPFIHKKIYIYSKRRRHILNLFSVLFVNFLYYDLIIYPVFSRSIVGDFFCRIIRAREKIAFDGDNAQDPGGDRTSRNSSFSKIIKNDKTQKNELDRNIEILSKLSVTDSLGGASTKLWFLTGDQCVFDRIKKQHGLREGEYVIVFPGAGHSVKLWAAQKWVRLLGMLDEKSPSLKIVVLGSVHDKNIVDEIVAGLTEKRIPAVNLCGRTSLRMMAKLILHARCLVSMDTAAVHIAAAVGTPNVCIMGGGHFGRFYPYGDLQKNRIVFKKMDCFGCNWNCVHEVPRCIDGIDPTDVFKEIECFLNQQGNNG